MQVEQVAPLASEYEFMVKSTLKKRSINGNQHLDFPEFMAAGETFLSQPIPDPTHKQHATSFGDIPHLDFRIIVDCCLIVKYMYIYIYTVEGQ